LYNKRTIADVVRATASHLRRFRGLEASTVALVIEKLWQWTRAFRRDPLCAEFLKTVRTSAPLWRGLFDASKSPNEPNTPLFRQSLHYSMVTLATGLILSRETSSEAKALTEFWVSIGIFDALESCIEEAVRIGTEDDQIIFTKNLVTIYQGVSYGPDGNSHASLMSRQLPRPRCSRRLWDMSLKLAHRGTEKVAPSHAARVTIRALEMMFDVPGVCKRRGCENHSTAQCSRCRSGYCGADCQKRDWREHKMVCGVAMEMNLAVKDEAYKLMAGPEALEEARAEMGR
jgi:hypothetical protein